ncbi:Protoporphyrinogen oxidase [Sphingobium faniae]|nr:Protoporphyrinogen oxidase [Sphingobium faniae]
MKAVVIGAGHAGLSAGHHLKKAGWDVTVLEAAGRVGGRASTFRKGPYLIEAGATQMSTGYQEYIALAQDLGIGDRLVGGTNKVGVMRNGRVYIIDGARPWTALFSGALTMKSKLRMIRTIRDFLALDPGMNVLDVSESYRADTESALEYADRRLNREIYNVLIDPMLRTYTINRGDKVSALEWFSAIRNLAGQKFLAIRGGVQSLPETVARTLDVRLNSLVTQARRTASGVEIRYRASTGEEATIEADGCVVATTLNHTTSIAPDLAPAMAELAAQYRYNRAVLVHLGYSKQTLTDAAGIIVPTVEHPQIGLVWLEHNKIEDAAPKGHSLITLYFEESGIDDLQPGDDSQFIAVARQFAERLYPELAGHLDMEAITRWDQAIPNPAPGIYTAIHAMKQRLDPASPIQPAGDYFTCTGQNSAIHWGRRAAENLIRHIGRSNSMT